MKLSFRINVLATIVLLLALLSARSTLQNMRSSGNQTDMILLSLDDLNRQQEKIFTQLDREFDSLNAWNKLQKDSLVFIKSPLADGHKSISYAMVSNYRSYQKMMETKNHYYYELIKLIEPIYKLQANRQGPGTSPDFIDTDILNQIWNYQEKANSIKNEYNQSARHHNSYIKGFPRNFYSSLFQFQSKAYIKF